MGEHNRKMAPTLLRISFTAVIALTLCANAFGDAGGDDEMDVQAYIVQLATEAGGAYNTAAESAATALKEAEAAKPSPEQMIGKCVCDQRSAIGDPCTDSGLDDAQEKKMRAEIASSCGQELAQMPGAMKEQVMNDCIKRRTESAGMEYKDPEVEGAKDAARNYIQETCEKKVAANKPKTISVVEDAESVILKCMCARTTCRGDEEQLALEEAQEEGFKGCKKQVAMSVAEAMGEGGEPMGTEEMSVAIQKCSCDARAESDDPCLSEDAWTAKKEELKAVADSCRKPLHDEL